MNRLALAASLALAAPVAHGWVRCDQKGITPPVPIQREAPGYPQSVREVGIEGSVELALTVLQDGSVGWVRALRAEPRGYFEQAAIEGVRRWRFAPAAHHAWPTAWFDAPATSLTFTGKGELPKASLTSPVSVSKSTASVWM